MENTNKSDLTLQLLMSDAVLLLQAIEARLEQMRAVDADTIDEDALSDMYQDQDSLERLRDYLQHNFKASFGAQPSIDKASYESALAAGGKNLG